MSVRRGCRQAGSVTDRGGVSTASDQEQTTNQPEEFQDPVPPSITSMIHDWANCRWMTPFGRFYEKCLNSTLSWTRRRGTGFASGGTDVISVFPMPLPFPEVFQGRGQHLPLRAFEARRRRKKLCSKHMANALVCICNFLDAGCPKGGPPCEFPDRELSPAQVEATRRLSSDAEIFCARSGGDIATTGRGRGRLNNMILNSSNRYGLGEKQLKGVDAAVTVAEKVQPRMVSLPEKAGQLRGVDHMCPERAKVFRDLQSIVLEPDQVPAKGCRACHMLEKDDEVVFVKKLMKNGMLVLIEEDLI